jgi:hypothetical protein
MRKVLLGVAAAALVAGATIAAPSPADARCRGCGVAAGVLGGLAAGAIIGNAIAGSPYYYAAPPPYYGPVYVAPGPVYAEPECYWTRGEPHWNGFRWVRPRIRVCD